MLPRTRHFPNAGSIGRVHRRAFGQASFRVGRVEMRTCALSLPIALGIAASSALAEPPDIENTGYITGCLKDGKLLSFEISGWGAYRPCWKHGGDAE